MVLNWGKCSILPCGRAKRSGFRKKCFQSFQSNQSHSCTWLAENVYLMFLRKGSQCYSSHPTERGKQIWELHKWNPSDVALSCWPSPRQVLGELWSIGRAKKRALRLGREGFIVWVGVADESINNRNVWIGWCMFIGSTFVVMFNDVPGRITALSFFMLMNLRS